MAEQAPLRPPRVLNTPQRQKQFKSFSSGRKGRPWEVAVNGWVDRVYRGKLEAPQTVIGVEDSIGRGLGIISLKPRELEVEPGVMRFNIPHVWMLGVDRQHHRRGIGSSLIEALLAHVQTVDPAARYVWAYVHPENEASHSLFEKYGFALREPAAPGHDAIRILTR